MKYHSALSTQPPKYCLAILLLLLLLLLSYHHHLAVYICLLHMLNLEGVQGKSTKS